MQRAAGNLSYGSRTLQDDQRGTQQENLIWEMVLLTPFGNPEGNNLFLEILGKENFLLTNGGGYVKIPE